MRAFWTALLGLGIGALLVADRAGRASLARRPRAVSTRIGTVEVEITGSGPDVLLLHGSGGGFDQGTWIAHALGLRDHRVIAISRPGYLGTPDRRTIGEAVDLCAATLDALGVEHVSVVGASAGGMSASALASRHPERVRALVMLSAVSGPVTEMGWPLAFFYLRTGLDLNAAIAAAMRTSSGRVLLAELARTLAAPERRLPGVRRDITVSRSFEAPQGVETPTLVIHGTADHSVPFTHAERTAAGSTRAHLVAVRGGGHLCFMTDPEVGDRVRAFLPP